MLTGSTSGLRALPTLSSKLSSRLLRSPTLFVQERFVVLPSLPRRKTFSSCPSRSTPEEQNGPESRDAPLAARSRNSNAPANWTLGSNHQSISSSMSTLPTDQSRVDRLVGIGLPSDTKDRQQHGCASRPQGALGRAKRKCPAQRRRTLLWVLLTAKAPGRAWAAYEELLTHRIALPPHLLHRLVRLLASIKPRTRTVHLQLLSVLKTLERNHGRLRLWEWNTLIASAGKQWHKTSLEDYENALDIFNRRGILPVGNTSAEEDVNAEASPSVTKQNPDIWTYNILLSTAARSNLPLAIRHASSLLLASGLTPNRVTHLCLLRYFALRNDLPSVRSTLRKMKEQGLEIGLDGINACLWAYARNRRFDVALPIYRVLRSNVKPTPDPGEHDVEEDVRYIRDNVGLDIPGGFEPDETTYTMMIQTLAYHGDLGNTLGVFVDMLSTPRRGTATLPNPAITPSPRYKPSIAAFRGLFLGFARHGQDPDHHTERVEFTAALFPSSRAAWDQDTLETIFAAFLRLPNLPKPTDRLIYWILVAFDKTSGNDGAKLRKVWTELEAKYGGGWGGRLEEIRKSIFPT